MSSPHSLHNYNNALNRVQPARRITELIDGLKAEYETLLRDTNVFVMQRDEYEKQLEYHRQESQRIQEQLFELEHYHKDVVSRYQEEIEYLKRQLEMADHSMHDSHVLNNMKYDTKRVLLQPPGNTSRPFTGTNIPSGSEANRGPSGGLPGVLSSLKSDNGGVIAGVVAGVVAGGRGAGSTNRSVMPPTPSVRVNGTPGIRGNIGARPESRGPVLVGAPPIEGGEESSLIIEEQDIVMASVNPSEK
eukprot:TRINITY_DN5020_c0_g2_i1.p1 TRINITY_DN5020_c0_g2~~TRINITY_DN5020_c0_g2_i1.p1  ORF type:complete len:246 (+),score=29.89 TRINITY_DN5020_c0_g2_i1:46-783(+)